MLISIVLTLVSPTVKTLPGFLGRANYAATLSRLSEVDPALARRIHDVDGPKPLTCSGLLGVYRGAKSVTVEPEKPVQVRVTGLISEVSEALMRALLEESPKTWELENHRFIVQEVVCDAGRHPWSGRTSYELLAATQLTRLETLDRQVTLEFTSPTAFKSKEMTMPVPLPGLVFGSLVERWNAFSPVALSPEMRRYGEEVMAISRYRLESFPVVSKDGAQRIGGVGSVTYRALTNDRYWLSLMNMLADFAFYSGVGAQTATGMGQVRRRERM